MNFILGRFGIFTISLEIDIDNVVRLYREIVTETRRGETKTERERNILRKVGRYPNS